MSRKSTDLSTTIVSWTRRLSLSALMVSCLSSPSWGQAQKAEIVGSPIVNEDRVTVRIKVTGEDERPVMDLTDTNFQTIVDDREVKFEDWKSPEESTPSPAWIVVLLDLSGSMKQLDSRGTNTRLEGAIAAIRKFLDTSAERGGSTQVAIIPFGEPGPDCEGYPVDEEIINSKFFPAGDFKQQNHLDYLAAQNPCASTNIYEPLTQAIQLLGNEKDPRFYPPEDSNLPQPRLAVILLSDGFHTLSNEAKDFEALQRRLRQHDNIFVHTLGYGLTPEQLGQKYGLGRAATRSDLGEGKGKVPFEEFVDRDRLAAIAQATGGIAEFSADAQTIAETLQLFLNALLGEYEIAYTEPRAERGSKHKVRVVVDPTDSEAIESESKSYSIAVFGRSLPIRIRLAMLSCIFLLMGLGGVVPFWFWGQHLKEEALEEE